MRTYSAAEAARALGISLDTLRRWDKQGKIQTLRDAANRRHVPADEVDRLRGHVAGRFSAPNALSGVVRGLQIDGLIARVELDIAEPTRIVAVVPSEAIAALALESGTPLTAIVNPTSIVLATRSASS